MDHLQQFIYTSVIADELPPGTVGQIVRRARRKNRQLGLSGLLIFDGERFCQYLEGPPAGMTLMRDLICQDPRHSAVREIYAGPAAQPGRCFKDWSIAYADVAQDQLSPLLRAATAGQFLDGLMALLPSLDIAPG
ncbi:BLUF domain-containing protein [Granulosicoccaceae sp. 1_MG-2023]|nr:BLUF domain-containing protein [Granulosicoccaceae sp. 1_MG-2023]